MTKPSRTALLLALALVTVSICAFGIYWIRDVMNHCQIHMLASLPGTGKYDAIIEERTCSGVAGSDDIIISLSAKDSGKKLEIFSFGRLAVQPSSNRLDRDPIVRWKSPHILYVDIDAVSFVENRIDEIGGVKILYRNYDVKFR